VVVAMLGDCGAAILNAGPTMVDMEVFGLLQGNDRLYEMYGLLNQ
jgi:hypothetical protein